MVRSARAHPGLIALLVAGGCASEAEVRLASGADHVCALAIGEAPRCWGDDTQLQRGGATDLGPSIDIGAGGFSTCAVGIDGAVRCLGFNSHGQLGDGTLEARERPVEVVGIPAMVEVSVGYAHACARSEAGEVYCWGWSSIGQAIPGTDADAAPGRVEGLPAVVRVRAGFTNTCALDAQGDAYCWGELTDGVVRMLASEVRDVAIGVDHVCFARPGELRCLGAQPGGGRPALPPEGQVFALDATRAAGGIDHACFATADGAACLGKNLSGQLGIARLGQVGLVPEPVRDLAGAPDGLAVGDRHSCAVVSGTIYCWGWNDLGQLGDDSGVHSLIPQPVP